MPSFSPSTHTWLPWLVLLVFIVRPSKAFGAGNIASVSNVEGQNWRHGDIEDTLLTLLMARAAGGKKFSKMDVKRVYFGNWLRDYSQAVDLGTVKSVSAEAIRILLWILSFLSFGYGTKEFEVTTERLGCYRPEEHIDNPRGYDGGQAQRYDRRLRGPVDERRELSVDPNTGLKNYIATENIGIATSAGLIRHVFGRSIQLGRQYAQSRNEADLFEALRLLGTGCHCLEDFSAHSNFIELVLIELGERGTFPHVGRQTMINLRGARQPVYPLVTGTFGGVDFLHSVVGELSDKAIQSEIQELEGTMQQSQANKQSSSALQDLLRQLPAGLIGGGNQGAKMDELQHNAQAAQMQHMQITPRQPEAWTQQLQEVSKQIYPALEWHDQIMKSISETIEKVPVLPDLIEQFQEQLNMFVFSLIAPMVMPIISQVKNELVTGSSLIIQTSRAEQLNVFHDDYSSDPTHSMLSKDHFSNVLNEPAGRIASQLLKWVVPQIMEAWDNEHVDIDRVLTRIIYGVFHHPALRHVGTDGAAECRQQMFNVVEEWWGLKTESERRSLREQLSRDGVEHGRNHKEGVHDSGHGCGKPLGMPTYKTAASSGALGGSAARYNRRPAADNVAAGMGKVAGQAAGGGALGSVVGGIIGGVGASLLGDALGGGDDKKKYSKKEYGADGSYTQSQIETGHHRKKNDDDRDYYAQAQYSQTSFPGGGTREEYRRYEQPASGSSGGGYGYQEVHTARPTSRGDYERTTETRRMRPGGDWETEQRDERRVGGGDDRYRADDRDQRSSAYGDPGYGGRSKDSDSEDDYKKKEKKEKKREKKERKKMEKEYKKKYGGGGDDDDDDDDDDSEDDSDDKYGKKHGSSSKYGQSSSRRERDDRSSPSRQRYGESEREYGSGSHSSRGYGADSREYSDADRSRYQTSHTERGDSGYERSSQGGASTYGQQSYGSRDDDRSQASYGGESTRYRQQEGYGSGAQGQGYGYGSEQSAERGYGRGGDEYGGNRSHGGASQGGYERGGGGEEYSSGGHAGYDDESAGYGRSQRGYGDDESRGGGSSGYGASSGYTAGGYGGSSGYGTASGYGGGGSGEGEGYEETGGYRRGEERSGYGGGGDSGYGESGYEGRRERRYDDDGY